MIPVIDGVETCRTLRAESGTRETPIMMLTAKSEETDQLIGFSVGADDYVVKPFSVRILLERVKSLLRRHSRTYGPGSDIVVSGNMTVDRVKHRVSIDEVPIDLTPSEFRLLDTLIRHPGKAFDRSELIDAALGADTLVLERTIDVHIRSLRKKLGDNSDAVADGPGDRLPLPGAETGRELIQSDSPIRLSADSSYLQAPPIENHWHSQRSRAGRMRKRTCRAITDYLDYGASRRIYPFPCSSVGRAIRRGGLIRQSRRK